EAASALTAFEEEAAPAVPLLVRALNEANADLRSSAARALGSIGPSAQPALAVLIDRTRDENEKVRRYALEALHKIGGACDRNLSYILHAMSHESDETRESLMELLPDYGVKAIVAGPLLAAMWKKAADADSATSVRPTIAAVMAKIGYDVRPIVSDLVKD